MKLPEGAVEIGHETAWSKVFRDGIWVAILEWHKERGEWTAGFVAFAGRAQDGWLSPDSPRWEVVSENPLTLSPSLACRMCGHHGWIRDGVWIPA